MELFVNSEKGYVPAPKNRNEDSPLGLISIDSLFSPVKKVSFSIENTRAGSALDYDKLVMNVGQMELLLLKTLLHIQLEFSRSTFYVC